MKPNLTLPLVSLLLFFGLLHPSLADESGDQATSPQAQKPQEISLLFAGDLMYLKSDTHPKDFNQIYDDVRSLIASADLTFANLEAPVSIDETKSNYPRFLMPFSYLQAAVNAGVDVFSLVNNHCYDHFDKGLENTKKATDQVKEEFAKQGKPLWFLGFKEPGQTGLQYARIEKNGFSFLIVAVTELLNMAKTPESINLIKTDPQSRSEFVQQLKTLREQNPSDLMILSLHTAEPEYIRTVSNKQEEFYQDLLHNGVDIVWANHAHIIKSRKIIVDKGFYRPQFIMYANGNFISSQRRKPGFGSSNLDVKEDNIGDGLLYMVNLSRKPGEPIRLESFETHYVTAYITPERGWIIKLLNQANIDAMLAEGRKAWSRYMQKRLKLNKSLTHDYIEFR